MLVSVLAVGVVCWLKGESCYPGVGGGWRRGCAGENRRQKAMSSVTSVILKIVGQDPTVRQFTWGHSAVSPLFWVSLLEVCCRPPGWLVLCGPLVLP